MDEQFSVPVGAVRLTEQFGLDGAVADDVLAQARAVIGTELSSLDGRSRPSCSSAWAAP